MVEHELSNDTKSDNNFDTFFPITIAEMTELGIKLNQIKQLSYTCPEQSFTQYDSLVNLAVSKVDLEITGVIGESWIQLKK